MPKGYRPYYPDQDFLLPPSLREWLTEDHLVYFVSDVVAQLDLGACPSIAEQRAETLLKWSPRVSRLFGWPAISGFKKAQNTPGAIWAAGMNENLSASPSAGLLRRVEAENVVRKAYQRPLPFDFCFPA